MRDDENEVKIAALTSERDELRKENGKLTEALRMWTSLPNEHLATAKWVLAIASCVSVLSLAIVVVLVDMPLVVALKKYGFVQACLVIMYAMIYAVARRP